MIRPKLVDPRGILHVKASHTSLGATGYARFWPGDELAPFVEHFWTVRWDEPAPAVSEVLAHPSVQMVLEAGCSRVAGVFTRKFRTELVGKGRVLGTKFLPGAFRAFLGRPVSQLTDRMLLVTEVFGDDAADLEARALAHPGPEDAFEVVQRFLVARLPPLDPQAELARRITERAAGDREITRVEHLAEAFALGRRTLQRLFDEYVGVPPKWVIQRYRLHEAAERIAAGGQLEWAALALDLGYADQAHFIRDFKRMVGRSPADYARTFRRA